MIYNNDKTIALQNGNILLQLTEIETRQFFAHCQRLWREAETMTMASVERVLELQYIKRYNDGRKSINIAEMIMN